MDVGAATIFDPHFAGTFAGNHVCACLQVICQTRQASPKLLSKGREVQLLQFAAKWDSLPLLQ